MQPTGGCLYLHILSQGNGAFLQKGLFAIENIICCSLYYHHYYHHHHLPEGILSRSKDYMNINFVIYM